MLRPRFIDIGANLTDSMYKGIYNGTKKHEPDIELVLKRSWDAGVERIIITGTNLQESRDALELASTNERLYCTVGCHPTRCMEFENQPNYFNELKTLIEENIANKKIVAIGEIGLDYDRLEFCSKEVQLKYFKKQISLCFTLKPQLPTFLHCRNAHDDLIFILNESPGLKGVVHSFDGTLDQAQKLIAQGFFIGLNGCSLKHEENLNVVKQLPLNRLLIETDSPWCEIRPTHAGYSLINAEHLNRHTVKKEKWIPNAVIKGRNEPFSIVQVADIVSKVKSIELHELSEIMYVNTLKLFGRIT